jgi:hypothetical protein
MNLFSSLSILYPLGAMAVVPFVGALLYAYRRRERGEQRRVSTVFLLQSFVATSPVQRKFFPPLRFWLELFLGALILLGVMGLGSTATPPLRRIILDNSLSMSGASRGSGTLFQEAIHSLQGEIDSGNESEIEVYITSPRLKKLANLRELSSVSPTFSADRLENALSELGTNAPITVISDRKLENKEPFSTETRNSIRSLVVERGGGENVGIQSVSRDGQSLAVRIRHFGPGRATGKISVHDLVGEKAPFSPRLLNEVSFSAEADGKILVPLKEDGARGSLGAYRVEVRPDGGREKNIITGDDTFFLTKEGAGEEILFVGDLSVDKVGLQATQKRFASIRPHEFAKTDLKAFAGIIFHRWAPQVYPTIPSLWIYPPTGKLFNSREILEPQPVVRWEDSHPLTRYLNLRGLVLPQVRIPSLSSGMESVVTTEEGPVIMAGQSAGIRHAIVGFELLPYEGVRSKTLSVLTLNLFSWLYGEGFESYTTPFEGIPISQESSATNEDGVQVEQMNGKITPTRPGFLFLNSGNEKKVVAINFFDDRESDVVQLPVQVEGRMEVETDSAESLFKREYSTLLATVIVSLLCLEAFISLLMRKRA